MLGDTVVIEQIGSYWPSANTATGVCNAADIIGSLEYFRQNKLTADKPLFLMVNVEAWGEGVHMVPDAINALKAGADADKYNFILPTELVAAVRTYEKNN
jgi:hypothetical protein